MLNLTNISLAADSNFSRTQGIHSANDFGYGLGKIAQTAYEVLKHAWAKLWISESSNKDFFLHKQTLHPLSSADALAIKERRSLQQANSWPNAFNLTLLNGTTGFQIEGLNANDNLGYSVSSAGDINGDGKSDLVLGAYNASSGGRLQSGSAYILFGKAGGWPAVFDLNVLDGSNGFKIEGLGANDQLGISVGAAGDINGDGKSDLLLAASGVNAGTGAVYVLFGNATGWPTVFDLSTLNGLNGFVVNGLNAADKLGSSVSTAGDINGDGKTDIILGASQTSFGGSVYVLFGKTTGFPAVFNLSALNGLNGFTVNSPLAYANLGSSVSIAGDINKDGIADLVLGAYNASPGTNQLGSVYILFGNATSWPAIFNLSTLNGINGFSVNGLKAGDTLGSSVSRAGDINADGIADLLLGADQSGSGVRNLIGWSYVLFGQANGWSANFDLTTLDGSNGFAIRGPGKSYFGDPVRYAGDINGDGRDDLVLGASSRAYLGQGSAYVLFGQTNGWPAAFDITTLNGSNGFIVNGLTAYGFGSSASTAGDINGDGCSDIIVGAPRTTAGTAYIIFGMNTSLGAISPSSTPILLPSISSQPSSSPSLDPILVPTPISMPIQSPQVSTPSLSNSLNGTPPPVESQTIGIAVGATGIVLLGGLAGVLAYLRIKKKACFATQLENLSRQKVNLNTLEEQQDDTLLIPKASIVAQRKIAEGSFGDVYLGTYQNREVAIKQLKNKLSNNSRERLFEEVKIMAGLRSPYVVPFYGVTMEEPHMLVMQYMQGGSLRSFLQSQAREIIHWNLRLQISHDTSQGLAYLHERKIVHRDLKSLNVLLDRDKHAVLADFGLATIKNEQSTSAAKESMLWMAPELFDKKPPSFASDLFSLGVVLWEIASHRLPFQEFRWNQNEISAQIKQGTREKFPEDTPDAYKNLAEKCWNSDPLKRPSAENAAQIFSELWKKKQTSLSDPNFSAQDPAYLTRTYEPTSGSKAGSFINNDQTQFGV